MSKADTPHGFDALKPKHAAFREVLQDIITAGQRWVPGMRIPPERELQKLYGISRNTVRKAISDLVSSGYLFSEVGRGTFVNARALWGAGKKPTKSKLVGLIITDVEHDFGKKVAKGVEDYLHRRGYSLVLCQDNSDMKKAHSYVRTLLDSGVQGVILDPVLGRNYQEDNLRLLSMLDSAGTPTILIDRRIPGAHISSVTTDNEEVTFAAADYLIQNGHRSIIVIRSDGVIMEEREKGVVRAYKKNGLPLSGMIPLSIDLSSDSSNDMSVLTELVREPLKAASALLSLSEYLGQITYRAITKLGKSFPGDLSFVTFDHPEDSSFEEGKIAFIEQPAIRMGEAAARIIVDTIEGGLDEIHSVELKSRLVPGKSVCRLSTIAVSHGA